MKVPLPGLTADDRDTVLQALERLDSLLRKMDAGAENTAALCSLLDRDDEIKAKALWCLGKLGQNKVGVKDCLPHIITLAEDQSSDNRENVAWALGELAGAGVGDYKGLAAAILLLDDEDPHVRGMAAWTVGRYADKLSMVSNDSLPALREMSESPSPYLKKSAEFALERVLKVLEK